MPGSGGRLTFGRRRQPNLTWNSTSRVYSRRSTPTWSSCSSADSPRCIADPFPTEDADITPDTDHVNLDRLVAALRELNARIRRR